MHHKSDLLVYELADLQAHPERRIKWSRENCFQPHTKREGGEHKEFCEELLLDSKRLISVPNIVSVSSGVDHHHFLLFEIGILFDMP